MHLCITVHMKVSWQSELVSAQLFNASQQKKISIVQQFNVSSMYSKMKMSSTSRFNTS